MFAEAPAILIAQPQVRRHMGLPDIIIPIQLGCLVRSSLSASEITSTLQRRFSAIHPASILIEKTMITSWHIGILRKLLCAITARLIPTSVYVSQG